MKGEIKIIMITIRKSPEADSRTSKADATVEDLRDSTISHIKDVTNGLDFIAELIKLRGSKHDNTKICNMEEFNAALKSGHIKDTLWYKKHITQERHHLKSNVPEDVNLIDVIEHVVDCTMAGLGRSGEIFDVDLSPELLEVAVKNTVELLKNNTTVVTSKDESSEEENIRNILDEEI